MLSQSEYYRQTKYGYARGWETVKYVQNIKQYYDILTFLDSQDKEVDEKDQDNLQLFIFKHIILIKK